MAQQIDTNPHGLPVNISDRVAACFVETTSEEESGQDMRNLKSLVDCVQGGDLSPIQDIVNILWLSTKNNEMQNKFPLSQITRIINMFWESEILITPDPQFPITETLSKLEKMAKMEDSPLPYLLLGIINTDKSREILINISNDLSHAPLCRLGTLR